MSLSVCRLLVLGSYLRCRRNVLRFVQMECHCRHCWTPTQCTACWWCSPASPSRFCQLNPERTLACKVWMYKEVERRDWPAIQQSWQGREQLQLLPRPCQQSGEGHRGRREQTLQQPAQLQRHRHLGLVSPYLGWDCLLRGGMAMGWKALSTSPSQLESSESVLE